MSRGTRNNRFLTLEMGFMGIYQDGIAFGFQSESFLKYRLGKDSSSASELLLWLQSPFKA